jgi:hypothetical protein
MSEENNINLKKESDLFILLTELLNAKARFEAFNSAVSSPPWSRGTESFYPNFNDLTLAAAQI